MQNEEKIQQLAAHILTFFEDDKQNSEKAEFAALRQSLDKINNRLDNIEEQLSSQNPTNPQSAIRNPQSEHPSQTRFQIEEFAIALLSGEKACPFEPSGKPCDHCSMCSSRGF
jgi:hypothetical protein